jgi:hypothetical protein
LQVLLVAGLIRAQDEKGQTIDPKDLERKSIGKTMFKVESATVTAPPSASRFARLLQKVGLTAKQGEELAYVPQFLVNARKTWPTAPVATPHGRRARTRIAG